VLSIPNSEINETAEGDKRHVGINSDETSTKLSLGIDIAAYSLEIRDEIWYLSKVDLEFIAYGTRILGIGVGGLSYLVYLVGLDALRAVEKIPCV
jgi:hypothetical protein